MASDPGVHRHRCGHPHAVEADVGTTSRAFSGLRVLTKVQHQVGDQREREETMGDGRPERSTGRSFGVHVNLGEVERRLGEGIDLLLGHLVPVAGAFRLTFKGLVELECLHATVIHGVLLVVVLSVGEVGESLCSEARDAGAGLHPDRDRRSLGAALDGEVLRTGLRGDGAAGDIGAVPRLLVGGGRDVDRGGTLVGSHVDEGVHARGLARLRRKHRTVDGHGACVGERGNHGTVGVVRSRDDRLGGAARRVVVVAPRPPCPVQAHRAGIKDQQLSEGKVVGGAELGHQQFELLEQIFQRKLQGFQYFYLLIQLLYMKLLREQCN